MKHYRVQQGTEEWLKLRVGKLTASEFEKVITPLKWKPTKGATRRGHAIYMLTEMILDMPLSTVTTASMSHGTSTEEKGRAAYEMLIGKEVEMCGFITDDAGTYGASPDAFVGDDGILELKSPFKPEVHVEYMMNPNSLASEYFVQVQGQLWVSQRKWCDLISYVGILPMVQVRCMPNPIFQEKLGLAVRSFCAEFSDLVSRAMELGYLTNAPALTGWIQQGDVDMVRRGRKKEPQGDFDLTDEDIGKIWEDSQKRRQDEETA